MRRLIPVFAALALASCGESPFALPALDNPNDPHSTAYVLSEEPTLSLDGSPPIETPEGPRYFAPLTVGLSAEDGAEIWYSLDGSDPAPGSAGSSRYTAPFALSGSALVKAAAKAPGKQLSKAAARSLLVYPLEHSWEFDDPGEAWVSDRVNPTIDQIAINGGYLEGRLAMNPADPQRTYRDTKMWSPLKHLDGSVIKVDIPQLSFVEIRMRHSFIQTRLDMLLYDYNYVEKSGKPRNGTAASTIESCTLAESAVWQVYRISVSDNPYYSNTIEQIRIDPADAAMDSSRRTFAIDYIRLYGLLE